MKALIIGISSFAGPFLAQNLLKHGFSVSGTDRHGRALADEPLSGVPVHACDITDDLRVREVFSRTQPDRVYLLAAQSSPQESFQAPVETFRTNTLGTVNVLAACRDLCPESRVLLISSGGLYDFSAADPAVTELTPCRTANPYALSKWACEQYGRLAEKTGARPHTVIVRPFNHTGPGQSTRFVVPAMAEQVAQLRSGTPIGAVETGPLSGYRDFSDVRDVVEAYRLALEHGRAFDTYNIASGSARRIADVLEILLRLAGLPQTPVRTEPGRFVPETPHPFAVDTRKFRALCGWQPRIAIEKTLTDILEWFQTGKRDLNG